MDKLIQDLGARANVLVTDLLEVQPVAGPPSEKGTVTQVFSDASGNVVLDRDARTFFDSFGVESLDLQNREGRDSAGTVVWSWDSGLITKDQAGIQSADFDGRFLLNTALVTTLDWQTSQLLTVGALPSVNWASRQLIGSDGTTVILDWNTTTPASVVQRVFSTPTDPNGVVTATKPAMCYGDDGSLWVKTTAGPDNTGWTVLISA